MFSNTFRILALVLVVMVDFSHQNESLRECLTKLNNMLTEENQRVSNNFRNCVKATLGKYEECYNIFYLPAIQKNRLMGQETQNIILIYSAGPSSCLISSGRKFIICLRVWQLFARNQGCSI
ncbi:MAG: hypothetical protein MHMPM18_000617 [Marteilia pararefringens]